MNLALTWHTDSRKQNCSTSSLKILIKSVVHKKTPEKKKINNNPHSPTKRKKNHPRAPLHLPLHYPPQFSRVYTVRNSPILHPPHVHASAYRRGGATCTISLQHTRTAGRTPPTGIKLSRRALMSISRARTHICTRESSRKGSGIRILTT